MHDTSNSISDSIRAWLRNDRRLGIGHVGVSVTEAGPVQGASGAPARQAPAPAREASAPAREAPAPRKAPAAPAKAVKPGADSVVVGPDGGMLPPVDRSLSLPQVTQGLQELDHLFVRKCTQCELHQGRNRTVFGVGNPHADLMFVGEGPGADEDRQGEPFVGKAGQLLTRMIAAMTLPRDQVYIANVVKCRPPNNRTPTPEESSTCSHYLWRQIALIRPQVIVALGRPAAQTLLATSAPIGRLRGQFHPFPPPELAEMGLPSLKIMPTFHPAYLLRTPSEKGKAWDDLKQVMAFLDLDVPGQR